MDSRQMTSYIRGAAILIIMATHYAGQHAISDKTIQETFTQVVYVFFVLSGLGAYYSLTRAFAAGVPSWRAALSFYARRALRIYPIFWLSRLLTPLFFSWLPTWHLNWHNLGVTLGAPWLRGSSFFWFISALIQCYLLAPFIYLLLRQVGLGRFVTGVLVLTDFLLAVTILFQHQSWDIPLVHSAESFVYFDNLLCENILLFALGMAIPLLIITYGDFIRRVAVVALPVSLVMIVASFIWAVRFSTLFNNSHVMFAFLTVVSIPAFCACLIALNKENKLIFRKSVCLLGAYSLSLYLFHPFFIALLDKAGLTEPGKIGIAGIFFTMLLAPVFILICVTVEKNINRITSRISLAA